MWFWHMIVFPRLYIAVKLLLSFSLFSHIPYLVLAFAIPPTL